MTDTTNGKLGIYVVEEQDIFKNIYTAGLENKPDCQLLNISGDISNITLREDFYSTKPDILILGTREFTSTLFKELLNVCNEYPKMGLVIFITSSGGEEAGLLRKLVQKRRNGIAIYLKQSLDKTEQLHDIILSVRRGQVVLDPNVASCILMEKNENPFMELLTDREMELLSLLAQGYTNQGIAASLCIDIKTVAHHLNNIYSKLKEDTDLDNKHPRVSVARLYLKTTGELVPGVEKCAA